MSSILPEVINNYNVYGEDGVSLIGISGEVELPEMEALTETLEGSAIMGEIDDPVTGQFSSMRMTIPFSVLYTDQFKLMNTTKPNQLTLRGSMQCMDPSTGETDYYPIRVVVRGKAANSAMGKIQKGKKMKSSVELEVIYLKVEVNGTTVLELDKLNFVFVLNGEDVLKKIREQC